jgi:hypothetical protein
LSIKKSRYNVIAPRIASLTPEAILRVAKHVESEGKLTDLTASKKDVLTLLKEVNTIGTHLPSSSFV